MAPTIAPAAARPIANMATLITLTRRSNDQLTSAKIRGIATAHATAFAGSHQPARLATPRSTRHCRKERMTPPPNPIAAAATVSSNVVGGAETVALTAAAESAGIIPRIHAIPAPRVVATIHGRA